MSGSQLGLNTLFLLTCQIGNQLFYLRNTSSLRNDLELVDELRMSQIRDYFFQLEFITAERGDKPCQYYQPVHIKHKYSNKFLSTFDEQEDADTASIRINLSYSKSIWKLLPNFKYQVERSSIVYCSERIFIVLETTTNVTPDSKFVTYQIDNQNKRKSFIVKYMQKTTFVPVFYANTQEFKYFTGQCFRIFHPESGYYLEDGKIPHNNQLQKSQTTQINPQVCFTKVNDRTSENYLRSLWLIETYEQKDQQKSQNNNIKFNYGINIKSIWSQRSLVVYQNSEDKDMIFRVEGQNMLSQNSRFVIEPFEAGDETQQFVRKNSQVRIKQNKILFFMAVSKLREGRDMVPIQMDQVAQDEHFFQLKHLSDVDQVTITFFISFKKQLQAISKILFTADLGNQNVTFIKTIYRNILNDLQQLEQSKQHSNFIKNQLKYFVQEIVTQIDQLHFLGKDQKTDGQQLHTLLKFNYRILQQICKNCTNNQVQINKNIHHFTCDLFRNMWVQELYIQIFRNNKKLLASLNKVRPEFQNQTLVSCIVNQILVKAKDKRNQNYWRKVLKLINLLLILIKDNQISIDLNQRLITSTLFEENNYFNQIFFKIQIKKSQIFITHPVTHKQTHLNDIRQPFLRSVTSKTLLLLADLCQDRNLIAKNLIDRYLFGGRKRYQDIKGIRNILNIHKQFRNQVLLLFTNVYVDSYPRISKYKPIPVLKMDITPLCEQIHHQQDQMLQLSFRLKQSLMMNVQKSYESHPLEIFRSQDSNAEPTLIQQQLAQFKEVVLAILQEKWQQQSFRIIKLLLQLDLFSFQQMSKIIIIFQNNLGANQQNPSIIKQIVDIIQEISLDIDQFLVQKLNYYMFLLLLKKQSVQHVSQSQIKHMMPFHSLIMNDKEDSSVYKEITTMYNEYGLKSSIFQAKSDFKKTMLDVLFASNHHYPFDLKLKMFKIAQKINRPIQSYLSFISNISIMGNNQSIQFQTLTNICTKLKRYCQIGQEWLCNEQIDSHDYSEFINCLTQLTNYMFQGYCLNSEINGDYRKQHSLNINRQLLLKNLGVHTYLLELLSSNYYLLEGNSKRALKKKVRVSFQDSFQFFCIYVRNCPENRAVMINKLQILKVFNKILQVGQAKLWVLLLDNSKAMIRQVDADEVKAMIYKIIIDGVNTRNVECQYNPIFVQQLKTLICINGKSYLDNITKMAKVLQQPLFLRKLLYLKDIKQTQFCLQLHKIKFDPVQVPIIYHIKILQILVIIIQALGNRTTKLRKSVKNILTLDYLFSLLAIDDIYSHSGLTAEMNFVLKMEVLKLIAIYMENNSIDSEVYSSQQLCAFLKHYQKVWVSGAFKKKEIIQDNQILFVSFFNQYMPIAQHYAQNQGLFYQTKIKPLLSKLLVIFDKLHNKQNNLNYQLIIQIINAEQTISNKVKQVSQSQSLDVSSLLMKWPNFRPFTLKAPNNEVEAKRYLFEMLTHSKTKQLLQQQSRIVNLTFKQTQKEYVSAVINILQTALLDFQLVHQKDLYLFLQSAANYVSFKQKQNQSELVPSPFTYLKQWSIVVLLLIRFLQSENFDYNKVLCRNIFHSALTLINCILQQHTEETLLVDIYNILTKQNDKLIYQLLTAINEIKEQIKPNNTIGKMLQAQKQLHFVKDQTQINTFQVSLIFLRQLCRYHPFCNFLRNQSRVGSIDFLELLFNTLLGILSLGEDSIGIVTTERTQLLADNIAAMFSGCNRNNQNLIADNKYLKGIADILKIQEVKECYTSQEEFDLIMAPVMQNYQKTIPTFKQLMKVELGLYQLRHNLMLKIVKKSLLKMLVTSLILNKQLQAKIQLYITISILKVNLIWLFQTVDPLTCRCSQQYYLQRQINWRQLYHSPTSMNNYLVMGVYCYSLIKYFEQVQITSVNASKQINSEEMLDQMEQQYQANRRKLFAREYQKVNQFFMEYVPSVQVYIYNEIVQVYFVKIPICDRITSDKLIQINQQSSRITQDQKLKSLLHYQQLFYDQLQTQFDFDNYLISKASFLKQFLRIMQYSKQYYVFFWIVNILISLLYIIMNHYYLADVGNMFLHKQFLQYLKPQSTSLAILMIFLNLINLTLGFISLINLIIKKIPFFKSLYDYTFLKLKPKQKINFYKYKISYVIVNIFQQSFLQIYFITLSMLTVLHPFFSGFVLVFILTKLQMGRTFIMAIRHTWISLLGAVGIVVVFDYLYSCLIYEFLTEVTSYGQICTHLFRCLKMILDQDLKGGFVFWLPSNYENIAIDLKFFSEIFYIIIGGSVIIQIFNGTIIDKLSELRQKEQSIQKDERTKCFICGQQQFQINFDLQGFEEHVTATHNRMNYIYYMFYLRRQNPQRYTFIDQYVRKWHKHKEWKWIPDGTSLFRRQREKEKEKANPAPKVWEIRLANLEEKRRQLRIIGHNILKLKRKYFKKPKENFQEKKITKAKILSWE